MISRIIATLIVLAITIWGIQEARAVEFERTVYLNVGEFAESKQTDLNIKTIKNADNGDLIVLYINSHGGMNYIHGRYVTAIKKTKACILAHVIMAESNGWRILTAVHIVKWDPASRFTTHMSRLMNSEGEHKFFEGKRLKEEIRDSNRYAYILTTAEKLRLFNYEDVSFFGAELTKRVPKGTGYRYNPFAGKITDTRGNCK